MWMVFRAAFKVLVVMWNLIHIYLFQSGVELFKQPRSAPILPWRRWSVVNWVLGEYWDEFLQGTNMINLSYLHVACKSLYLYILALLFTLNDRCPIWRVKLVFHVRKILQCEQGNLPDSIHMEPLTPRSDSHVTSPYNIYTLFSKQVMRKLKIIS